jgi:pimeloyl-ACP methyl ester carboxylesterase
MLNRPDGESIAYQHREGRSPGILFLSGFNSNMQGDKALALDAWCAEQGRQFTRFDYFGHGQSSGAFEDGRIGRWRDDALAVLDEVALGPQVLVGSSMGGWLMLLLAMARPQRLAGLVGIAAAPDFTDALANSGLSPAQRVQLQNEGYCDIPNCYDTGEPYRISRQLLEEGKQHCLLGGGAIPIDLPVRLLHGQQDEDVPWEHSLRLAQSLRSKDVEVQLVKSGDHRLSQAQDIQRLQDTLQALLATLH